MNVVMYPVTTLPSGCELALAMHEFGPRTSNEPLVGISAAIHGDESTGTLALMELARRLRGVGLEGRVLLLPVANPLGLQDEWRNTPHDGLNLNRHFPGSPEGWVTEQVANCITENFLRRVDVFIDVHSGGRGQTVDYTYIRNDEALSRSFGSRILYRPRPDLPGTKYYGTTSDVAIGRGIPVVTVEIGGGYVDQRPYVERAVCGLWNMLVHLRVIPGELTPLPEQIVVESIATVRPRRGGILETCAGPLGSVLAQGDVLGRVFSPQTFEELEAVVNPVKRGVLLLSHLTTDVVWPGDYGYLVGTLGE